MRQIVLDTETTGLEISQGHRIIEIGCIELVNRRVTENHWHFYINPEREVDSGAFEVGPCGNGVLDPGEACDDGNTAGNDCCSPSCQFESGPGSPDCCVAGVCNVGAACGAACLGQGTCQLGGLTGDKCNCRETPPPTSD